MRVELIDGKIEKITLSRYRELKANAFALGTMNVRKPVFAYKFCEEAYENGRKEDIRLRHEMETNQR